MKGLWALLIVVTIIAAVLVLMVLGGMPRGSWGYALTHGPHVGAAVRGVLQGMVFSVVVVWWLRRRRVK